MTSQTGINRDYQNWILQVAFRKSSFWFLISQLWISDFQELRFAISHSGFRFLISEFWFQVSEFWFLNCHLQYRVNHGLKIKYFTSKIIKLRTELHVIYDFLDFRIRKTGWPQSILILITCVVVFFSVLMTEWKLAFLRTTAGKTRGFLLPVKGRRSQLWGKRTFHLFALVKFLLFKVSL